MDLLAPSIGVHFLALMLLGFVPIMVVTQLGWSYAIDGVELVVCRFGRERFRMDLRSFRGSSAPLGLLRLHFQHGNVWIISSVDAARQEFLAAVRSHADALGASTSPPSTILNAERLRIQIARLHFPHRCVRCAAPATSVSELSVKRGVDLLVYKVMQFVEVDAPVCASHRNIHLRLRRATWWFTIPMGLCAAVALKSAGAVWSGALLIGLIGTALVYLPIRSTFLKEWADWWSLGIRADSLSGDLSEVTLRFADRRLLEDVHARAMADEDSGVAREVGLQVGATATSR